MSNSVKENLKKSIKPGDLFELGDHRLICGDATDEKIVKKLLGDEKIKSVITDPPYGIDYVKGKDWLGLRGTVAQHFESFKDITGDKLQGEDYKEFSIKWLKPILNYLKSYNTFYIFNSDKEICELRGAMKETGIYYSQLIIWVKSHQVLGRKDYNPQHELIVYGWHGRHKYRGSKSKSVLFYPKPNRSSLHPTMKPIGLLRKLILNSTDVNEIIYDGFGGSGSTLIAAEQTKRRCFMIELDPGYIQTIIKRFEKITGKQAKKVKK